MTDDQMTGDQMTGTWLLDEFAHAGPEHLDAGFVAGYDQKQGYPDPAADLAAFEAHGLLEPLLSAAGFEIADVSYERRLYGTYTCIRR